MSDRERQMREADGSLENKKYSSKLDRLGTGQGDMIGLSNFYNLGQDELGRQFTVHEDASGWRETLLSQSHPLPKWFSYFGWLLYGSFAIFVFISVIYLGIRFDVAIDWRASHPSDWVSCSAGRPADQTIEYNLSTEAAKTEPRPPMYPEAGGLGRDITDSDRWLIMQILTIVENQLIIQPLVLLALAGLQLYWDSSTGKMESKENGLEIAHAARTCHRKTTNNIEIDEHVNLVDFLYPHQQLGRVAQRVPPNGIFDHSGVTKRVGLDSHQRHPTEDCD